jgi:hypothetical protein
VGFALDGEQALGVGEQVDRIVPGQLGRSPQMGQGSWG